jgi:histone H3/H4
MSWKSCSTCRKDIEYSATYWVCSVSTCNRKRLGLYFCSVACWDSHLPEARHREAWAVEEKAPSKAQALQQEAEQAKPKQAVQASAPARRTVAAVSPTTRSEPDDDSLPKDVLVVVSKLKKYVKARSEMKTSDTVIPVLSEELRRICDRAIRVAAQNGRKTVLDREVRDALKS